MTSSLSLLRRFPALAQMAANPVVMRDLRAQMRGTKSYWYQGGYLLLLGILAVAGYAQATGQNLLGAVSGSSGSASSAVSIVEAQGRLESFYYFIFLTLAALITLIAPALTASSIVGERQRLSLDLLLTTPLTASQLLIGKLISSVAFLGLLLALSLPASALCVLLGGTTIGDMFRVYFLLAVDGVVLAGIGLFFSCAVRVPLLATVWTYATVAAFLIATGFVAALGCNNPVPVPSFITSVGLLNPFLAVMPLFKGAISLGTFSIPTWIVAVVGAALFLRFLLTAATYRLAVYGGESGPSLRRQVLLLSGLLTFALAHGFRYGGGNIISITGNYEYLCYGFVGVFLLAIPFLPGLFVPASAEDAPPGVVQISVADAEKHGLYNPRRMFSPEYAGALPLYHLWVAVVLLSALAGLSMRESSAGFTSNVVLPLFGIAAVYLLALGFLFWAVARRAAGMVSGLAGARAVAFGIFLFLSGAPLLSMSLFNGWTNNPIDRLWIFQPLYFINNGVITTPDPIMPGTMESMTVASLVAIVLGAGFLIADRRIALRKSRHETVPAASAA